MASWTSTTDLQSIQDFPYDIYINQLTIYEELEAWENGVILDEKIVDKATNKSIDKYPIKINPIENTAEKHTTVLFGQMPDTTRIGGMPVRIQCELTKPEDQTKRINDGLKKIFSESGGGALMISNGLISQTMGGCVFWATFLDDEKRILVTNPHPKEFVAFPTGKDYQNLREAWVVREITWQDALSYGYPVPPDQQNWKLQSSQMYFYIEKWTKTDYRVQINDLPAVVNGRTLAGKNPWGVVPGVYIPHVRKNSFLGQTIITKAVKGLIRELNLRYADIGDAVSEDSHPINAIRNVRGNLTSASADGRRFINLGSTAGIGTNEFEPDLFSVKSQSASQPMLDFADKLESQYRLEVKHPSVADGVDEGSQRSALTLSTRMWPLTSHVELERTDWTTGLMQFGKILLKMAASKGLYGITSQDIDMELVIRWNAMIPRDRETITNEASVRAAAKLGSRRKLMELFGDVLDREQEFEDILEEEEDLAEITSKLNAPEPPGDTEGSKPQKSDITSQSKAEKTPKSPSD